MKLMKKLSTIACTLTSRHSFRARRSCRQSLTGLGSAQCCHRQMRKATLPANMVSRDSFTKALSRSSV